MKLVLKAVFFGIVNCLRFSFVVFPSCYCILCAVRICFLELNRILRSVRIHICVLTAQAHIGKRRHAHRSPFTIDRNAFRTKVWFRRMGKRQISWLLIFFLFLGSIERTSICSCPRHIRFIWKIVHILCFP